MDEPAELQRERDALHEEHPLAVVADHWCVINGRDVDRDEVLQVQGTVGALPGCEVVEEGGSTRGVPYRGSPGQQLTTTAEALCGMFAETCCEAAGWLARRQAAEHAEQVGGGIVHRQ
ncbi:hypothetical protein ACFWBC_15250 [Streptomyces sp. NPDC059985]|uniref:hypothetical protein n=1 Tax=Streptomyces sp. NPDC059985 TaxID=3347025 RepID=UPI0036A2AAC9